MKQMKTVLSVLAVLLSIAVILCGCGRNAQAQQETSQQESVATEALPEAEAAGTEAAEGQTEEAEGYTEAAEGQTEPAEEQTEKPSVQKQTQDNAVITTETLKYEDGTVAETVTTVETLTDSERTTVRLTTTCTDGTVLVDVTVTEEFRDGARYVETSKEIRYPEGGSYCARESQTTKADMTFLQVEEYVTKDVYGGSYTDRTEISVDAKGNTTIRTVRITTDKNGTENREETVSVTDKNGNPVN